MQVLSVNVGVPRQVIWNGAAVSTSIFKDPVQSPVIIKELNLVGDRQADLTVHGGTQKAVYGYPVEHYPYWQRELPGTDLSYGNFGENLTTQGLLEEDLCIGDRLRVGSAILTVTQPRTPCYKLGIRFGRDDMIKRFLASGYSGFYFSVTQEGEVEPGSKIEILSRDPNRVLVADINRLYVSKMPELSLLERSLNVSALPQPWKDWLAARSHARQR
jgi:MOSC domain-containing protein YiiM